MLQIFSVKTNRIFTSKNYGKFAVITRSRTGSNLLISLLDSHKDIIAYGEEFQRLGNRSSSHIYNEIFPLQSNKIIGFKLFYYHPIDSDDTSIWETLIKDRSFKIIHLRRENLLRVHISRLIAEKTDNWASRCQNSGDDKIVYVNIDQLLGDFASTNNHIKRTRKLFKYHRFLEVTYENLTEKREATLSEILRFLEVPNAELKSPYTRQNPEKIQNLVANYDELYSILTHTEYSFMLEKE